MARKQVIPDDTPYEDRPYSKREINEFFQIKERGWSPTRFMSQRTGDNWFAATDMAHRLSKQGIIKEDSIYCEEWCYF